MRTHASNRAAPGRELDLGLHTVSDVPPIRAERTFVSGPGVMSAEIHPNEMFLTAPQLFERWQCSHMYVVSLLERDADFPKPSYFGRRRRWRVSEIEAYERIVTARGAPPKKAKQTQDAA